MGCISVAAIQLGVHWNSSLRRGEDSEEESQQRISLSSPGGRDRATLPELPACAPLTAGIRNMGTDAVEPGNTTLGSVQAAQAD